MLDATLLVNELTTEAPSTEDDGPRIGLVIVFALEDRAFKSELVKHLSISLSGRRAKVWSADDVLPGDDVEQSFHAALASARTAAILVSADFLVSDTAQGVEWPILLDGSANRELRVVPVLVRPCNWKADARLGKLRCLPTSGSPISAYTGSARDAIYQEIADELASAGNAPKLPAGRAEGETTGTTAMSSGAEPPSGRGGPATLRWLAALFGAATLFFLMFLAVRSTDGKTVPCSARFIVVAVFALGLGLSTAFVTGDAAIRGQLPVPGARKYPIKFSAGGGLAASILILALGYPSYVDRPECDGPLPDPVSTVSTGSTMVTPSTPPAATNPVTSASSTSPATTSTSHPAPQPPPQATASSVRNTAGPPLPAKRPFKCTYFRMIGQTRIPDSDDMDQPTLDSARVACAALCAQSMGTQVNCSVSQP